jgi:tetrahydromethanopterin S-methyltransferase subunit H
MDTSRIRMSHPYGQTPPNIFSDHDWIRRHEKELLEKYGECAILVYKEQVVGTGDSLQAAIEDAERTLPPEVDEITPIHEWLAPRNPFLRAQPKPVKNSHQVDR